MASPLVLRASSSSGAEHGLKTHTLIRIRGSEALASDAGADRPAWVDDSLRSAPWVVVRRAPSSDGLIPVGVRGELREQRFASWVSPDAVLEFVTPQTLASCRVWATTVDPARRTAVAALAALDLVERIMDEHGLDGVWGPAGSVGFELASGRATATVSSDLDLAVEFDGLGLGSWSGSVSRLDSVSVSVRSASVIDRLASIAGPLWTVLAALPVRVDVLLETPGGAVALSEYTRSRDEGGPFVLRTAQGPRLTQTLGHTLGLRA